MFKIKVNNKNVFDIDIAEQQLSLDGTKIQLDIRELNNGFWSVIYNNKSHNVELVEIDKIEKNCKIKVNGHLYHLNVEDKYDQLLQQLGMDNLAITKVAEVKAPMPGLVLALKVKENDEVLKGDSLLILEAMKMENILKSPIDGIIKKIVVEEGNKVEKNQVLVIFK